MYRPVKKTKTHTHKKIYKVQCLDVYELFDDCVEHDHFYTRRFLIKDHGFALGVCCLLVTVWWGGRFGMGLSILSLCVGPCVGMGQGQEAAQHHVRACAHGLGWNLEQEGTSSPCLLFPRGGAGCTKVFPLFSSNLQVRSAPPPSGPSWVN